MGLKSLVQSAAQKALVATGDIAVRFKYLQQTSAGVYDPTTGLTTATYVEYPNVRGLVCRLTEDDLDWFPANVTGQKLLVSYLDLPIETDDADFVVIGTKRWNVFKRKEAPGDSLHILYLHMPSFYVP